MTVVSPDELVPLLKTPGGGGAAPLNWLRVILGLADRGPVRFIPWLVLLLSIAIGASAWQYLRHEATRNAEEEAARRATLVAERIEQRLGDYQQAITALVALLMAEQIDGETFAREKWETFAERVGVHMHYPAILGLGFIRWYPAQDVAAIELVYPKETGQRTAIGFDVFKRTQSRAALERARDTGIAAITEKINLVLDDNNIGFNMYLPVFRRGMPLDSIEGRRQALLGFVSTSFRARDFFRDVLRRVQMDSRFVVFDGDRPSDERVFFDSFEDARMAPTPIASPLLRHVNFGGREWTVAFFPPQRITPFFGLENAVLGGGVMVSLILFMMTAALVHSLDRRKQANMILAKRNRHREAYGELGRFALVSGDIDGTIDKAIAVIAEQTGAEYVSLLEHIPADRELLRRAGIGWGADHDRLRVPIEETSPAYHSLTTGETVLVRNFRTDTRFKFPQVFVDEGICCTVTALVLHGETPWGILVASSKRPRSFGADEAVFIQTVANIVAEALRRRHANELLHQAQKMEAVGQLTGGIAHDFNNLLTVVMGNMELLLDDPGTPAGHRSAMEMTMQAARRGADLTQKMLAFSRRQPLRPQMVELDRIIPEMEGLLKRTLGEHIEIETQLPRDLWKTHVDRTQLETAILNLAVNARDAMPNGGRLIIQAENAELDETFASTNEIPRVGPYVCLTIEDAGTGMTPDVLARVFEPFFTTKDVGKGSGLGLSMVYGFVRQSGGYLKIYSEEGQGTTVRIYLPRAEGEGEAAKIKDKPKLVRGTETVLVVEDDPLVRELAVGMIAKLGYDVVVATNGKEALGILESDRPVDLMFSDLVMPGGVSGAGLATDAVARRPGIKVLLTSGYSEHTVTKPGEAGLGFPLVLKPYRASDLAVRIRALLDDGKVPLDSVA